MSELNATLGRESKKGCEYCRGEEAFVDEKTGITAYITFDGTLEIDSDGGTAFVDIKACPWCGNAVKR